MKVLFVLHEASRTGAPLIVLHLIKWLKKNVKNIRIDVLLLTDGVMENDFKSECSNTFVYSELNKPLKFSELIEKKIKAKFGVKKDKERLFLEKVASNKYDLIYANSIASIPVAVHIKKNIQSSKLLVHVHELNSVIKILLSNISIYTNSIDKYIAVSKLVETNLIDNYGIDKSLIEVVYEFGVNQGRKVTKTNEVFTVGASGTAHWRKGDDIFIQVANYINKNYPSAKIEFIWVGNNLGSKWAIESDLIKLNLNNVKFVGDQSDPIEFYKNFDVFLLTSREDPFPLVCIETASLGIPIICFEKASGTTEIIEKGGGFIVPYLDIHAMAEKIMFYYNNPKQRNKDGKQAKELFAEFTPDKIAPLLYEEIVSLLD